MNFTICTILQTALFYWPLKLVLRLGLTRRVVKSLHLVAMLLVSGFVLDWMKAYLVYSPQNVRLFTLLFCLETEKSFDSSLVYFVLKQRKVLIRL